MSYTIDKILTHIQIQQLIQAHGTRNWDWQWQGVDGNNVKLSIATIGPNLLGAVLYLTLATLLDINYQPINLETQEEIED